MQVSCPHCSRVLDVSGDPPVFCAYCGQPLKADPQLMATAAYLLGSGGSGSDSDSDSGEATIALDSGSGTALTIGVDSGTGTGTGTVGERDSETVFAPSSSGRDGPAEPDPEQIAGYTIVRLLGRGGMGSVYEAEDSTVGRRVALKLIAAAHVSSAEAVERFRQEGRLASTISHPRCVFVLGADEFQGRPYIVMELMPGETLQSLVERSGPLPVEEAIAKILDVIEGLQEAHLQGVIHRDVKPSNCFLDADGRVKIGDFGLSKSLGDDAGLTRTGSFIGTPLYASPEQIKRDAVDERTDIYSVAATLYFLFKGRPPFAGGDAAAVLARIVSEDPTPMRDLRPDLPPALEAVVLRGMVRDRDGRWPDLARFRDALLPFVATGLKITDQAVRVSAYLADMVLLFAVQIVCTALLAAALGGRQRLDPGVGGLLPVVAGLFVKRLAFLAYFAVTEGLWGTSLGKRLTRLRVSGMGEAGIGPPGVGRALARAAVVYLLVSLPTDAITLILLGSSSIGKVIAIEQVMWGAIALGYLLNATTMRAVNGYRGLHELASGTRVVRLPRPPRRRVPRSRRPAPRHLLERTAPAVMGGVLEAVGPFAVQGAVRWDGDRRVLLGEDPTLGRPVWLVLRPKGSPPPSPARRDLGRPGRPRWLNGGEQGEYRWDAYAPQLGCPLADLAGSDGLPWADARPILHDLADELARASADGTLPQSLSVDQVWIQPDGTVQLVDPLEPPRAGSGSGSDLIPDPRQRALELLRRTAATALEGGRRRGRLSAPVAAIHAAVPAHAGRMLDRLIGRPRPGDAPYADVAALVADLEADRDKPTEVDVPRRAAHLGPSAVLMLPMFLVLFLDTLPDRPPWIVPWHALVALPTLAVLWSTLTHGGLLLGLTGLALVCSDGRPAGRWRCGWRALLVWAPVIALLAAAVRADDLYNGWPWATIAWTFWGLALLTVLSYPVLALVSPSRTLHDRLAGTWLVPR